MIELVSEIGIRCCSAQTSAIFFVQVVQQREAAIVGLQQPGRVQKTEIAVERFAKPPEQSAQLRNEAQYLRSVRRFGADPFVVRNRGRPARVYRKGTISPLFIRVR